MEKKGLNIEKALEVREYSTFYAVEQGEGPPLCDPLKV